MTESEPFFGWIGSLRGGTFAHPLPRPNRKLRVQNRLPIRRENLQNPPVCDSRTTGSLHTLRDLQLPDGKTKPKKSDKKVEIPTGPHEHFTVGDNMNKPSRVSRCIIVVEFPTWHPWAEMAKGHVRSLGISKKSIICPRLVGDGARACARDAMGEASNGYREGSQTGHPSMRERLCGVPSQGVRRRGKLYGCTLKQLSRGSRARRLLPMRTRRPSDDNGDQNASCTEDSYWPGGCQLQLCRSGLKGMPPCKNRLAAQHDGQSARGGLPSGRTLGCDCERYAIRILGLLRNNKGDGNFAGRINRLSVHLGGLMRSEPCQSPFQLRESRPPSPMAWNNARDGRRDMGRVGATRGVKVR